MTRSTTPLEERYAVAWALPQDDTEQPDAADPTPTSKAFDAGVRCPACGGRRMRPLHVPDVGRCDRCLDCERLWTVRDGRLELVLLQEPLPS